MDIAGKSALVTGGASGLGRATAERLQKAGAQLTILDLPGSPELDGARLVPGDVTNEDDVQRAVDAADEVRILVCCAGIGTPGRILSRQGPHPLDTFRRVIDVNLIGTFNALRLAAQRMAELEPVDGERGVAVQTASVAAFEGQVGQAAYAASKAGVAGLTICAARDLASSQIRVCTIAPGIFETPMLGGLDDRFRETLAGSIPHPRRLGQPSEYADLAVHIIQNQMLNGETIRLDGAIRMAPR